jgi:hypothetical protein
MTIVPILGNSDRGRATRQYASIPCVSRRPWEGDRVAHIGEAGDIGEGALEAEPPTPPSPACGGGLGRGRRHRAVAAQVAVPGVVLLVDAALGHAAVQYPEALLALAARKFLSNREIKACRIMVVTELAV